MKILVCDICKNRAEYAHHCKYPYDRGFDGIETTTYSKSYDLCDSCLNGVCVEALIAAIPDEFERNKLILKVIKTRKERD